jgi:hypothetical protein
MTRWSHTRQLGLLLLCFTVCLVVVGCGSKVSEDNYKKIKAGMTEAEVQAVLGNPTETAEAKGTKTQTWKHGDDTITVSYADGKVLAALSSFDLKKALSK